ncbi:hypothetical protein CC80DRAFT_486835 [Byssothecium circinans]|uniref:Chitin synthesis regulation, congo red resistance, RCR protein n=1 Tax=Byssothecium circinans TaxID=147558 RepID=A0A6A5UEW2_9PLEO|nr:hypothetical protein CC80DRAFT_486835 [Byssothecium circinans]
MARCYYSGGYRYCDRSAWSSWVRWVVLTVVVVGFLLLFVLCSCITARRRRKAGRQPFYGTGWAARPGQYNAQPYYNDQQNYTQPPPQYSAQPGNNGYYGQIQGYYGNAPPYGAPPYGQQNGVELQPPPATHNRGGEAEFQPPPGPPPGKGDGVIR